MRSIRMDDASRAAKIEIEQGRGAVIIRKEQKAQYRNTWDLQDKANRENLPDKTTKKKLEYERYKKNMTEMMCELLQQQAAPN